MRLRVGHLVPMVGHDTYVRGHGRMLGKVFGLITVADGSGEEFDSGELSTYLNDAVLLAPSMLLGPQTTWTGVDDSTFTVALRDAGREVSAQVSLDPRGAPRRLRHVRPLGRAAGWPRPRPVADAGLAVGRDRRPAVPRPRDCHLGPRRRPLSLHRRSLRARSLVRNLPPPHAGRR